MSDTMGTKGTAPRFSGRGNRRRRTASAVCLALVAGLAAACGTPAQTGSQSTDPPADVTPPQLLGVRDLTVALNGTLSYRDGVSAEDDVDGPVAVTIDAAAVDLTAAGEYTAVYSAQDAAGNRTEQTITVTVVETATVDQGQDEQTEDEASEETGGEVTQEDVDALADEILGKITNSEMSRREKARAIFNYVNKHIKYVGSSDKSSWLIGAYTGFTRGRGDCYNYFACSKALLTRAGIPNVDLTRAGGNSRHYWQLVNTGDGWYHFDACPHPTGYPLYAFMITETQVRTYTEQVKQARKNYYVYDYEACSVEVEGMPPEGWTPPVSKPPEEDPEEPVTPPEEPAVPPEEPVVPENPAGSQEPGTEGPAPSQDPITGEWSGGDPAQPPDPSGGGKDPTAPPPNQSGAGTGGEAAAEQQPDQSGEEGGQLAA